MAARFIAFATVVAVAKAGLIGAPVASGLTVGNIGVASPLLAQRLAGPAISPYGLGLAGPAISPLGLAPRVASPYGLGLAHPAISPLGLAPRVGLASPLGLAPRAGLGAPLGLAGHAISPLGLAPRLAAPVAYAQGPVVAKTVVGAAVDTDYDPNPSYSYAYDVQDALTGDSKNQQESRQGDVVQGSYSLVEPDGTRRTVEYTADPVNGFNAVVHREPLTVAKTVVAAPAIARVAPLGLAQTIIH